MFMNKTKQNKRRNQRMKNKDFWRELLRENIGGCEWNETEWNGIEWNEMKFNEKQNRHTEWIK